MNKRQIKKLFKKCYVRRENVKNRAFLARKLSSKWKKCNREKLDLQASKHYRKFHPPRTPWSTRAEIRILKKYLKVGNDYR